MQQNCIQSTSKKYVRGFTLIETLVTIGIFGIMMLGVTLLFRNVIVNSRQQILSLNNTDQARTVEARFVNEIRDAAYGADGSYPITVAADQSITFFSLYNNGSLAANPIRIRYYLSGTTLYRAITVPSGSPLAYVSGSEVSRPVQNDVQNGSNPILYYYDGNYTGSTSALTQPVNLTVLKFVEMRLTVLKQNTVGTTSDTFTIKAGSAIRNLKTNLGD